MIIPRSARRRGDLDNQRMIAQRQRHRNDVGQRPDGCAANRGVVDFHRWICSAKLHADLVRTLRPLAPNGQRQRAIALLEEQVVDGRRLVEDVVVELAGVKLADWSARIVVRLWR